MLGWWLRNSISFGPNALQQDRGWLIMARLWNQQTGERLSQDGAAEYPVT